ncbi:hypothetical protein ACHWQZ_G001062 [Mnemiopsis leidyi]
MFWGRTSATGDLGEDIHATCDSEVLLEVPYDFLNQSTFLNNIFKRIMAPLRSCLLKAANQLVPIIFMCTLLAVVIFVMDQNMPGYIVGDINLSYPKQKETFTTLSAFGLMFIYPVLVVFHSLVRAKVWGRGYCSRSVLVYWWDKTWCGVFICFVFVLFSEIMKRFVGKLRPNFFAMCDPRIEEPGVEYPGIGVFVTNYTCQNEHGAESARSFPSGHSLFAILLFSAMGNLLQVTTSGKDKVLDPTWASRLMAQSLITFVLGPLIALTRFTEHYHHATDVLVGIILGYIAFICLIVLERWFIVEPYKVEGNDRTYSLDHGNGTAQLETNVDCVAIRDKTSSIGEGV